jgi:hypothetical protein
MSTSAAESVASLSATINRPAGACKPQNIEQETAEYRSVDLRPAAA